MPRIIRCAQGHVPTQNDNIIFAEFSAKPTAEATHQMLVTQGIALADHLFSILPSTSLVALQSQIDKRQRQTRNLKALGLVP